MATITPRQNKNSTYWRVMFRRKDCPFFSKIFFTKKEAVKYAKEHEWKFIENSHRYIEEQNFLDEMREREFKR